ncbi:MAG TPA: hypothetical protein VFE53_19855 [Mucilaginibacter sp.]|jgi:hypothetical protein|nr:hypothetical protein [Mucilaginibacter sp.]
MHPEIDEILNNLDLEYPAPSLAVLNNAARILNYMDDIYVERRGKFEHTAAESLYIMWALEGLEFHIECLKNGNILYTFRKGRIGKLYGSATINEFMPLLQGYLLAGIA